MAGVLGAAIAGSFMPHLTDRQVVYVLVVGLVGVPYAATLLFASEGTHARVAAYVAPISDLGLFAITAWAFPSTNGAVLFGYLVAVVYAAYTAGRLTAAVTGVTAIGLVWLTQLWLPLRDRPRPIVLWVFGVAVLGVFFVFERTALIRSRAASLQSKSDVVLESIASAVFVADGHGIITESNPAAERLVGHPGRSLVGMSCAEALGLHLGERELDCSRGCALLEIATAAEVAAGVEVWRTPVAEERQPLLASAAAVDTRGHTREVVHSIKDITRLKQADEAKTLFLATASHELKTPLTVINGFAETLSTYDDLDPELRTTALDAIRRRALELTKIVDRLLLSSRIEAGRLQLVIDPVDVGPLVTERTNAFAFATGRNVRLQVGDQLPLVLGNAAALETVVDHLVDNALKYSPRGEPVDVSVEPSASGIRITVEDRGIGMDAEQASECFEKFWQAESMDTRRFGGTGIGLYVVQSLVEAMGGAVGVTSDRGKGSKFTVDLCAASPSAPSDETKGEPTSIREFMRQIGVPERASQ